jgi:uncharacterized membrane protein
MTAFRLISLPLHGAAEMLIGTLLMAAPFVVSFGPAGTVAAVILGALLVGLSLSGAAEPGALPLSSHVAFDQALAVALVGAGVLIGLDGDRTAALTLALAGLVQIALTATTSYSRAPGH